MNTSLFLSNVAEIKISYSSNVKSADRPKITCSKDSADIFRHVFPDFEHREYFYALMLNRANKVLGFYEVSKGGINGTIVDIRLILQSALKTNASSLIVCHNHPSGQLDASDADLKITRKIKSACDVMDLNLLDHIIITSETYISFADDGLL